VVDRFTDGLAEHGEVHAERLRLVDRALR